MLNDICWAFGSIESLVLDVDNSIAEKGFVKYLK